MGRSDLDLDLATRQRRRRRRMWATVLGAGIVSASALVAIPAIASSGEPGPATPRADEKVVVCESGVVEHGDGVRTSSASAEWVPGDAPVPDGCTAR